MGLYNLMKKHHNNGNYEHIKEVLETERKVDNTLDSIIDGNGKVENLVDYVESQFAGKRKISKNKVPDDDKYKKVIEFLVETLDMNGDGMLASTEDKKKYWAKRTTNATLLGAGSITGYFGAVIVGLLYPPSIAIGVGLLLTSTSSGGYALFNSPRRKIKKARTEALGMMRERSKEFDSMLFDVYESVPEVKNTENLSEKL